MLPSRYTFSIASGASSIPVTPLVEDLLFDDTLDENTGIHRRRLATDLPFCCADYTFLKAVETATACSALELDIKLDGVTKYTGYLRIGTGDVRWDEDNCRVTAKIEPNDQYSCLFANWEAELNLFQEINNTVEVNTFLGTLTEATCGPANAGTAIEILGYFEQNVSSCLSASGGLAAWSLKRAYIEEITPGSSYDHYATYVSEQITVSCTSAGPEPPPGDGWVLITNNCPTNALYGRAPQMIYDGLYSPDSGKYWDNRYSVAGADVTSIDNAMPLNEVLELALPCDLTIRSNFFGLNASGTSPDNTAYDEAAENLQNVVLFQKSDVKRPDVSNNATQATWTYKGLLDALKKQFNTRFEVTGTELRLEHVSYFDRASGDDFTTGINATLTAGTRQWSYDNSRIAKVEQWKFMEDSSHLFAYNEILYGECVSEDATDKTVYECDKVNNDVGYIMDNPDAISDEGFVFANTYVSAGDYYFITEASEFGGDLLFNGHMSWANLTEHYHLWDRPLPSGRLNNAEASFESYQRRKRQVTIQVKVSTADYWDGFDPAELVKTTLGWGEVVRARWSAASCIMEIDVRHG